MPLKLHRAERADVLVAGLAELLARVPGDPFTPDVVAVPSRGVERWIAQSLSSSLGAGGGRADGVCANVAFPSPARLVRDALAAATGVEPHEDPWVEHRLVWPLLEVIDDCGGEAWCRTLGRHLGVVGSGDLDTLASLAPQPPGSAAPPASGRRMAVAQKLAGLYSAYAAERPSMLLDWSTGRDTDGYDGNLDADLAWQAELWRRLRTHIGADSPAERLGPACDRLRDEPALVNLPERLSIFGPTRLATDQLAVLDALAAHRELHLWLPHPSDGLWGRVANEPEAVAVHPRREDPTAEVPRHPLVRSLGRDAREMQVRIHSHVAVADDEHLAVDRPGGTLLSVLQADLAADRAPDGAHEMAADGRSVQVHSCHGRQRQVEVLREVLLGLLADDPTLELRDIIVMCPDIEAYAPLISASFGVEVSDGDDGASGGFDKLNQGGRLNQRGQLNQHGDLAQRGGSDRRSQAHPGHQLTFRMADRSLRQTNPVLGVAATLLELADSRMTASEILDLVALPPVRRRFRLDDDALERVGDWVRRAGVRWGLDAEAREGYGLGGVGQNTWRAGLDRILAGVTMDEDDLRLVGDVLPLDDVDSTEIDLAGRLAELVDRLDAAVEDLSREQPVEDWIAVITDAVDSLVDVPPADAWQTTQARATLTGAGSVAGDGGPDTTLRLSDVRALLGDRLRGRPTRANFRTGHLTVCTMVPMRSVPHRVVCMLGLDDGVFPRGTRVDGDDVLARNPRVGERDRRSEDRQLFLDAILAAKERLVILYTGADERTGAERPPAVPLGELLDVLERTATGSTSPGGVLVRHPLQPFDVRNFEAGRLVEAAAFSFDRASYDGSVALRQAQGPGGAHGLGGVQEPVTRPFLAALLEPAAEVDTVSLDSLVRFLEHPVRGFLRERLELRTADEQEEPSDAVPVAPNKLEEWAVGDRMLRAGLGGHTADDARLVERARGALPPGRLGASVLAPLVENVGALIDKSAGLRAGEPTTLDVSVELPSGVALAGTVPRIHGDRIVRIEYSKLSAKHRIRAWVHLLALCAQWPDRDWSAVSVGRGDRKNPVVGSFLSVAEDADVRQHLDDLVAVYRLGLTRPLPVPPKTAYAYAERRSTGLNPVNAAAFAGKQWRTGSGKDAWGEFDDADHRLVGLCTMDDVTATPAEVGAALGGSYADEPHLFGRLARMIWSPLLACEAIQ